ncbi:MAG: hypothetical protein QXW56_02750 [Nitrososphaerota archaeon]
MAEARRTVAVTFSLLMVMVASATAARMSGVSRTGGEVRRA